MTKEEVIERIEGLYEIAKHESLDDEEDKEAVDIAIKALGQEPKWIPCSEKLPEETGTYLVTLEYKEHGTGITTLWFHGSIGWDLRVADVVTAWMPLPEPYKAESEEVNAGSN